MGTIVSSREGWAGEYSGKEGRQDLGDSSRTGPGLKAVPNEIRLGSARATEGPFGE